MKQPQKERAAAPTTALTTKHRNGSYQSAEPLSSLKVLVGGLLLFGNKKQKVFWPFFDATLRLYVDLKLACQSEPEKAESTNTGQRVSE
jgi:hypothetical protein